MNQRQLPVHSDHDGDDAGQHEDILENRDHAGGKHFVERVDIGGDAGYQAAYRVPVEKPDVHVLQMAENLAAEIEHHLLSGPLHEVGLDELQGKGEDEDADVEAANLRDAGQGERCSGGRRSRNGSWGLGQIFIDGNFCQVGPSTSNRTSK